MKLKKWLIFSYIAVMVIPIITGFGLFRWINRDNSNREVNDYLNALAKFTKYEAKLQSPKLYEGIHKKLTLIDEQDKNKIQIVIYNRYGVLLYDSTQTLLGMNSTKEELFSKLYTLENGYRAYSLKKPVFDKAELLGFYKINVSREEALTEINNITLKVIIIFVLVQLLVFFTVIRLVNRKFNRPILILRDAMSSFAKGEKSEVLHYQKKDEIGELIVHFNNMKQEIEDKRSEVLREQKGKGYMVAAISHDLKTPLTVIRANAEGLKMNETSSEERQEIAEIIVNKSDYMKSMLDDLLEYTSLTSDYKMDFTMVEGQEFFEMLLSGYDIICKEKGIHLTKELCVMGSYEVDVPHMIRLMDNVVSNGIRHTKKEGNIYIGAFSGVRAGSGVGARTGVDVNVDVDVDVDVEVYTGAGASKFPDWVLEPNKLEEMLQTGVVIVIYNEGEEIAVEEQAKIFDPFYQIDNSRTKGMKNRVGLGLSIVKLICQKHNGKLEISSVKNKGTQIAIWLENKEGRGASDES